MDCNVKECLHCEMCKCLNCNNGLSTGNMDTCPNFDADCELCMEMGYKYFDCPDCCLSEDEYYGEDDYE